MSLYAVRCSRCEYETKLVGILRSYGDPSATGQAVSIHQTAAWCRSCRRVVWAEQIEELDQLRVELADLLVAPNEYFADLAPPGEPFATTRERLLTDLQARIAWRRERASPPRCLECGAHEILAFPERIYDDEGNEAPCFIKHPGCGGDLSIRDAGLALSRRWVFYSTEGVRRGTFEVSPARGLVPSDA